MALEAAALETSLLAVFNAARANPMSEADYARKLAAAITDQIKTAGIPAGAVITAVSGGSGAPAVGSPNMAEINVA
jgi:hypothetical protein